MAPVPRHGAYAVISLDPAASLWDMDDAIVREEIAKFKCGRYVATASKEHHALSGPMPVRVFTWDFLRQGLPPSDQRRHFESYQTVPVFPTTKHPENRRPVEPLPHLPWENCYHARMYRTVAICANRESEEDPHSCLSPEEAAVLDQYLSADIKYTHLSQKAKKEQRAPPPHDVPAQVLMAIRVADRHKRTDGKPWWEICRERAEVRMQEEASTTIAPGSLPSAAQMQSNGDVSPSSPQEDDTTEISFAGERPLEPQAADVAPASVPSKDAKEAAQEHSQSVPSISANSASTSTSSTDGPESILAALLGVQELDDNPPWIKIESYDIEQFDVPPDPLGFFAELYELHMIRVGYQLKQQKRLAKLKRQDAEYVESLGDSRTLSLSKPRFNARLHDRARDHMSLLLRGMTRAELERQTERARIEAERARRQVALPSTQPLRWSYPY